MKKLNNVAYKVKRGVKKNSPAILLTAGVVGFVGTAYLTYKAAPRLEGVVGEVEELRAEGLPVDTLSVVRRVGRELAPAIFTAVLSTSLIVWSYKIQTNRVFVLSSSLAAANAAHAKFENKVRRELGPEKFKDFITKDKEVVESVDEDGEVKETIEEKKAELDSTFGEWFCNSDEYTSDDHTYNLAFIESRQAGLDLKLFGRGHLLLNEVREALGFPRIRAGALLGWSTNDLFEIETVISNEKNPKTGEIKPEILITWSKPKYIYDSVEFSETFQTW